MNLDKGVKLVKLEETHFSFNPFVSLGYEPMIESNIKLKFNVSLKKEADDILNTSVEIFFYYDSSGNLDEMIRCSIESNFRIIGYDVQISSENVTASKQLIHSILSVSIGALRGILIKNLYNTEYKKILLPLIDLDKIMRHVKFKN